MKKLIFFLVCFFPLSTFAKLGPFNAELLEVIDGDTIKVRAEIWINAYKETSVRVLGIDTPEIKGKCDHEKELANRAKALTTELLTSADKIRLTNIRDDKYGGRVVANVIYTKNNKDYNLAEKLINANLAVKYRGKTKTHDWCVLSSL